MVIHRRDCVEALLLSAETLIDESTEQTTAEFMTYSSPNSPMRPRPNARDMKLICELTDRRLNAATHLPMEPPKRFRILAFLVSAERRK